MCPKPTSAAAGRAPTKNLAWFAQHANAVDVFANIWNAAPKLIAQARQGRITLLDPDTLPAVTSVLRPLT
jgi:hypothetical protein